MKILDKIIVSDTQPYNKNVIWCDTSGSIPYLKYYIKGSWKSVFIQKMYEATVYVYSNNTDYGTVTGGKTVKVKEGETASVELKATPASGYVLSKWQQSSDGITYTDIPDATNTTLQVTLTQAGNYYYKAVFEANNIVLTLGVYSDSGYVEIDSFDPNIAVKVNNIFEAVGLENGWACGQDGQSFSKSFPIGSVLNENPYFPLTIGQYFYQEQESVETPYTMNEDLTIIATYNQGS